MSLEKLPGSSPHFLTTDAREDTWHIPITIRSRSDPAGYPEAALPWRPGCGLVLPPASGIFGGFVPLRSGNTARGSGRCQLYSCLIRVTRQITTSTALGMFDVEQ